MVNVSWLLNGTEVQINTSVKNASYTNTSAVAGTWNVSAIASNENGAVVQTWLWNVSPQETPASTPTSAPTPGSSPLTAPTPTPTPTPTPLQSLASNGTVAPSLTPIFIYGYVFYENDAPCNSPAVNITNLNTSKEWRAETRPGYNYYQIVLANGTEINASEILQFNATDGVGYNTRTRTVTQNDINTGVIFNFNLSLPALAPFVDAQLTPDDDPITSGIQVINTNTSKNKTVTVTANVTNSKGWAYIDSVIATITGPCNVEDSPVSLTPISNSTPNTATYKGSFNLSKHPEGEYNVKVVARNADDFSGTCPLNFSYYHKTTIKPSPILIYGYVFYKNGSTCTAPFVVVTNLNTNESFVAEKLNNSSFFQLITDSAHVKTDDVLQIEASKNGTLIGCRNYTVNETNIAQGRIELNINEGKPDIIVSRVSSPLLVLINQTTVINATVCNPGTVDADRFNVTLYANNSYVDSVQVTNLSAGACTNISLLWRPSESGTYNITLFADSYDDLDEINETNNKFSREVCVGNLDFVVLNISLNATPPLDDCPVIINATIANLGTPGWNATVGFYLDNNTAPFATNYTYVGANGTAYVEAVWIAEHGKHLIRVKVDPFEMADETNEMNNENTTLVDVKASRDFYVYSPNLNLSRPLDGDTVSINVPIFNNGTKEGNCSVEFWDAKNVSIERMYLNYSGFLRNGTDFVTQPGAIAMRLHFSHVYVKDEGSYLRVYDEKGVVREFTPSDSYYVDEWVNNCSGNLIRIESNAGSAWDAFVLFEVDRYEALIENKTVSVPLNKPVNLTANWSATTGNHTISVKVVPVDPDFDETNNGNETTWIDVQPSRDFRVANIPFTPQKPFARDNVTINATIENTGVRGGDVIVCFYLDDIIEIANTTVFVTANETTNGTSIASVIWENAEPGEHTITAILDPFNFIGELNETNNRNETSIFVDAMDFAISTLLLNTSTPAFGEDVLLNATVKNIGNNSGEVTVGFYLDNDTTPFDTRSVYVNTSGENSTTTVWHADLAGHHTITAKIDPYNDITELNESNNAKSAEIFVNGTELAVLSLNITQNEVYYDEGQVNMSLVANITNSGAIPASNFSISFFNDSSLIKRIEHLILDAGESMRVNATWNANFGNHSLVVRIDADAAKENDMTNNELSKTVEIIPDVDFTITDIKFDPENPKVGENVTINASIKNLDNGSCHVKVGFYLDSNATAFATRSVFLDANGTNYTTATWKAVSDINHIAQHDITVKVDPDERIVERNEDNNTKTERITMTLPDLTIENNITITEHPAVGSSVEVTATIKNNENEPVNSTLWLYEENSSIYFSGDGVGPGIKTWDYEISHPGARMMRIHFSSLLMQPDPLQTSQKSIIEISVDGQPIALFEPPIVPPKSGWTAWGEGSTLTIHVIKKNDCDHLKFKFDKYDALLGSQPVTLPVGETNVTIPWNATTQGNHTLWVQINENKKRRDVFVSGTDLAVTGLSLNATEVREGDVVNINAVITNLGLMNASNFTVLFKDYNVKEQKEQKEKIIGRYNYSNITLSAGENISISTNWTATPHGLHDIIVEIDSGDNPENNLENNIKTEKNVPVGSAWDFAVTNINFSTSSPKEGEEVEINVTIENFGKNGTVNISLFVDGEIKERAGMPYVDGGILICNATRVMNESEKKYVTANWTAKPSLDHLTAKHEIIAWVDPDNEYDEVTKECNNIQNKTIHIKENISILDIKPERVICNNIYNLTAVIENKRNESANISAWFFDFEGEEFKFIGNDTSEIPPLERENFTVLWNTAGISAGNHTIRVWTVGGERNETVFVHGTDLGVTNISIDNATRDGNFTRIWDGNLTTINVTIHNFGLMNATNFTVIVTDISEEDKKESELYNRTLDIILGHNESTTISVPWIANITKNVGGKYEYSYHHTIKVEVIPENRDWETGLSNNTQELHALVIDPSRDFDFSITNISFTVNNETRSPFELAAGENVTLNATLSITNRANRGGVVEVGFYLDKFDGEHLINKNYIRVEFDAREYQERTATLHWHIDVAGNHTLFAVADPENLTIEMNETNNATYPEQIYVRAPDLTTKDVTFNPDTVKEGDAVNITVTVVNKGDKNASNVSVSLCTPVEVRYGKTVDPNHPEEVITQPDATKMRIHWHGFVGSFAIFDEENKLIGFYYSKDSSIAHVTPWISGNKIRIEHRSKYNGEFFTIDTYEYQKIIKTETIQSLAINETANISVSWNASQAGLRDIFAIIDTKDNIIEQSELNNELKASIRVQGADLTVSNIRLERLNGTEIGENETIKYGEWVKIFGEISNIGVLPANNFSISFGENNKREKIIKASVSLAPDESRNIFITLWRPVIGNHRIEVEVDPEECIFETDKTNNIKLRNVIVEGADLLVKDITFMVIPPDNATANTNATNAIYDTDVVMINATIANEGVLPAEKFTTYVFYEYASLGSFSRASGSGGSYDWQWENRSYNGAECILLHIDDEHNIENNLIIYDKNGNVIASPAKPGWIPLPGDTVKIHYNDVHGVGFEIHFYAGNITKIMTSLDPDELTNVSMIQNVSTGNHIVRVFVDPENRVHENSEDNNIEDKPMRVFPSRDFTAGLRLFYNNETEIGVNDTVWDGDQVIINATVGMGVNESDPYHEYRKGTVDVEFVDEHEWVHVSPRYELTPDGYAQVITHPGADAMRLHFSNLSIPVEGGIWVKNESGSTCWTNSWTSVSTTSPWLNGDTFYVYKSGSSWRRVTFVVDKYQYKKVCNGAVSLNASETKNVTAKRNMSAGSHTIRVIADPKDKIVEINESNNEVNKTLLVDACKDPAVVNITFDPAIPGIGDDVTVKAHVANKGNRTATFSVDLWAVKTEYHPYESPHDADFPCWTEGGLTGEPEWEIPSTYPEADWFGVHFTRISTFGVTNAGEIWRTLYVDDGKGNRIDHFVGYDTTLKGEDIWVWAKGEKIKLYTTAESFTGEDWSFPVWGFSIDKHAYKIILNQTTLTLGPNETANVSGVLRNVRVGNGSLSYMIYAAVDTDNVVYESNESNNELSKELKIGCPDLTVSEIKCEGSEVVAKIENIGYSEAKNVKVRFIRDVKLEPEMNIWNYEHEPIWEKGADVIRLHVKSLYVDENKNGSFVIYSGDFREEYRKSDPDGFWSPWIKGDSIALWRNHANFTIDKYEYGVDERIGDLGVNMGKEEYLPDVECPHKFKDVVNEVYNLTVSVDPDDEIEEKDEGNNEKRIEMGPDLTVKNIEFEVDSDKLIVNENYTVSITVKNERYETEDEAACVNAENITITLYVNKSGSNITVPPFPKHEIPYLLSGASSPVKFPLPPLDKGFYDVKAVVDLNNDIPELNEGNNTGNIEAKAGEPGYKAKENPLETESGEGNIEYIAGSGGTLSPGDSDDNCTAHFGDPVGNATLKFIRLYVYPDWAYYVDAKGHKMAFLPNETQLQVTFNDEQLNISRPTSFIPEPNDPDQPADIPDATDYNVSYATYCYDVPIEYYKRGEDNYATAYRKNLPKGYVYEIRGMALLVVYDDKDAPLTKYWISEADRDAIMAKNLRSKQDTGFSYDDCTREIEFEDVKDARWANATLKTVLVSYSGRNEEELYPDANNESDALYFNSKELPIPKITEGTGHWGKVAADIALTKGHGDEIDEIEGWEYVDVRDGTNYAAIQSRGAMFCVAHAFLKVTYPPDLVPSLEKAPSKMVIGNSYDIPVVINNVGKSKAKEFNVSFYVDDKLIEKKPVDFVEGEGSKIVYFTWTAPSTPGIIVEFKVVVDPDNDVEELINSGWDGETNNNDTKTASVDIGSLELPHPGGGGAPGKVNVSGDETAAKASTTATGSGEATIGATGGETITGRLMKGIVVGGGAAEGGGGGERGEFSWLGLLIRIAMLAVIIVLVCAGYLMERRRQNNKLSSQKRI